MCNLYNTKKYVTYLRALNQTSNHGLVLEKGRRIIKLNQEAWIKLYIDLNTELTTNAKINFEKDFFKLINNSVFLKTMEYVKKHSDINFATTEREEIIRYQNEITTQRNDWQQKFVGNENEEGKSSNKQVSIFQQESR